MDINDSVEIQQELGQRLKAAREKGEWSQEDVAKKLRLRICVIQALEENDYDFGVPLTYVQGYLKNYARLLGISEDEIRPVLNSLQTKEKEPILPLNKTAQKSEGLKTPPFAMRPILYVALFVIVSVLVILWQTLVSKSSTPPMTASVSPSYTQPLLPKPEFAPKEESSEPLAQTPLNSLQNQ